MFPLIDVGNQHVIAYWRHKLHAPFAYANGVIWSKRVLAEGRLAQRKYYDALIDAGQHSGRGVNKPLA
jgi:hypothetical protein